jgi:hypothetical protein
MLRVGPQLATNFDSAKQKALLRQKTKALWHPSGSDSRPSLDFVPVRVHWTVDVSLQRVVLCPGAYDNDLAGPCASQFSVLTTESNQTQRSSDCTSANKLALQ